MKFLERTKSPNGNFAELNHDPETFFLKKMHQPSLVLLDFYSILT